MYFYMYVCVCVCMCVCVCVCVCVYIYIYIYIYIFVDLVFKSCGGSNKMKSNEMGWECNMYEKKRTACRVSA